VPDEDHPSLHHLVARHELPEGEESDVSDTRAPLSCRVYLGTHNVLEFLSERWGLSKAAVTAQILEAAVNEILNDDRPPFDYVSEAFDRWKNDRAARDGAKS
jgi:hypothetical protein